MNDFSRIERIIRHLDEHRLAQPTLSDVARVAGLSEGHLHRLFTSWAGITPKEFLQALTLSHARALLESGRSVLDASLESGLSGPGRLHDLCVQIEAATPGEVKAAGAGWKIFIGVAESPFGRCVLGTSPRGICHLGFVGECEDEQGCLAQAKEVWPRAEWVRDDALAASMAAEIFAPKTGKGFRTLVKGSRFQVLVWRALLRIPSGHLVSYGRLADALQMPGAARAVGNAVGCNDISFLIPCHRVIRETGALGNYRWGAARKRALLAWEMKK